MTHLVKLTPEQHQAIFGLHRESLERRLKVLVKFVAIERLIVVYRRDGSEPRIMIDEPVHEARP